MGNPDDAFDAELARDDLSPSASGEFIVYRTEDGRAEVQLRPVNGTVWLTQSQMAELYSTSVPNINQIIHRILADGEVTEATINSQLMVRREGTRSVKRQVKYYNLDMVLAVGYRVTTLRAVQFRQWATTVLREYLIKGFAMNDARLKDPQGADYFDELLERIRDIRASEKQFYLKVREVFKASSVDYDSSSKVAQNFFATIQNKLLFAVTKHTAAELVIERGDIEKPNMGLTAWKGAVVRKGDVCTAKNYLSQPEIQHLNRLTTMFLDYAEDRAERREQIHMADWVAMTDRFLEFNERDVLRGAGRVSHEDMQRIARQRYDDFDTRRREIEEEQADLAELKAIQDEIERRK
ncbi:hypothetical protein BJY24_002460 [Nocardia transvalensis]|uniref:Virulence RhuM family protein n=1 Tax=Nocardia transvalensis TaxID=37333 RepID=A0A7W9UHP7_9NOCA|nr:virulence RhuM family protein [Nocardia transvalensis]MBB5913593.1 hypothetical protein [Nocardia transvalensis]